MAQDFFTQFVRELCGDNQLTPEIKTLEVV